MPEDVRWKQRFDNFEKRFLMLKAAVSDQDLESYGDLELEGVVQRFETTLELAWKLLRDYLVYQGYSLQKPISPKNVVKESFRAGLIENGEDWIVAYDKRNEFTHEYSEEEFLEAVQEIQVRFYPIIRDLYLSLKADL